MKKSVLGRIIDENAQTGMVAQQFNLLQLQLQKDPTLAPAIQPQLVALQAQLANSDKVRQLLIAEIEKITKRRLLTYFSVYGSMSERDSRIIEDFLYSNKVTSFDLLLDSPGGFTDAAEKMIKICRMRTGNDTKFDFRTIVVNQAKSAATLFALGSTKVLLSSTAELGPVDPQIVVFAPNGEKILDSAHQIFYGSQKYIQNSSGFWNFRRDGDLLLLSKYDPIAIKRSEEAISHTDDIISKRIYTNPYLKEGYDNGSTDKNQPIAKIKDQLKVFTEHASSHSHGRPIYYEDIKEKGYCINKFIQKIDDFYVNDEHVDPAQVDKLQELLWELTIRSLEIVRVSVDPIIDMNGNQTGINSVAKKLFESSNGLILTSEPWGQ